MNALKKEINTIHSVLTFVNSFEWNNAISLNKLSISSHEKLWFKVTF